MKITVTLEEFDLKQLIRLDLARQGITATDADITITNGEAVIRVEVTRDDASLAATPPRPEYADFAAIPPRDNEPPPPPRPATPASASPPLQVVEGGNNPVDMTDVLGASARIARAGGGKFPVPERQLMEGESHEFPGGDQ